MRFLKKILTYIAKRIKARILLCIRTLPGTGDGVKCYSSLILRAALR